MILDLASILVNRSKYKRIAEIQTARIQNAVAKKINNPDFILKGFTEEKQNELRQTQRGTAIFPYSTQKKFNN